MWRTIYGAPIPQMRIVGAVHFERCLPEQFHCVNVTTSRMALADALENDRDVPMYCQRYLDVLEPLLERLENYNGLHLKQQWLIGLGEQGIDRKITDCGNSPEE